MTPDYINFDQKITFTKVKKESIVKLGEIIPDESIENKFINNFYILSRKKNKGNYQEISKEG